MAMARSRTSLEPNVRSHGHEAVEAASSASGVEAAVLKPAGSRSTRSFLKSRLHPDDVMLDMGTDEIEPERSS
jgi:hypothetical protein